MTVNEPAVYVGGRRVRTGQVRELTSPVTGLPYGSAAYGTSAHLTAAARAATTAFDGVWAGYSPEARADLLDRLADLYEARRAEVADLIHVQVGCVRPFAEGPQTTHPLAILRYYAQLARDTVWEQRRPGALIRLAPVGPVAAITPWNMPQKTIMMKVAPALAAGCTVVIKPAEETPLDAMWLARLTEEAGFPPGVINVVPADRDTARALVTDPAIAKVAFTGSTAAGAWIGEQCAARFARHSLELGGKSATIVCEDADLAAMVAAVPAASLLNNGQICSNQTRILAHYSVYRQVWDRLADLIGSLSIGDPGDVKTEIGPLITARQAARYRRAILSARDAGATIAAGGPHPPPVPDALAGGNWVTPTLITAVDNADPICRDEVFGPLITLQSFRDDAHAARLANDSRYGLHAGVWSADPGRALTIARQLRVGQTQINGAELPLHTPLGGFKQSGVGRELGPEGLAGYYETAAITEVGDRAGA